MTDSIATLPPKPLPAPPPKTGTPGLEDDSVGQFWSTDEGPTFAEFLDIINPLQHIPVVSTIYRAITGDEIGHGPRAIGGFLFGGPAGAIASGIVGLIEEASGGDVTSHIAGLIDELTGGDGAAGGAPSTPAQLAAADNDSSGHAQTDAAVAGGALTTAAAMETAQRMPPEVARQMADQIALAASAGRRPGALAFPAAGTTTAGASSALSNALSGNLNRIAFNPAAALGVPASGQPAAQAPAEQPAAGRTPFFPARPLGVPFAAHMPVAEAAPANDTGSTTARTDAAPRTNPASATRLQADALLAKWASQQMQMQSVKAAPAEQSEADPAPASGIRRTGHPMLPPENASPEWFASAMGAVLNRYQAGMNTQPGITAPAVSVSGSALPRAQNGMTR